MEPHDLFYATPEQISGNTIRLQGDEHHHLRDALRKRPGDRLAVVDGRGTYYQAELVRVDGSSSEARILACRRMWGEPRLHLTVATAVPKGSRVEYAIEKGTEIGVSRFVPLRARRSVVGASPTKVERWQRLALAAMKQSRRSVLPEVAAEMTLESAIDRFRTASLRFVATATGTPLEARMALPAEGHSASTAVVLIGPEGGFTDDELERAFGAGFVALSLGPRRLRVETAAVVAATLILHLSGDLSPESETETHG